MDVRIEGGRELIASLDKAISKALPEAEQVMVKGAVNIKEDWRRRWSGHPHFPALPNTIGFDLFHTLGTVHAQIGPDKDKRQGPLGSIIEFGTPKNAPIPGGLPALEAEVPRFERALADLGERLLS